MSSNTSPSNPTIETQTGQFNFGVAISISILLAIILVITLTSIICTRLHLGYLYRTTTIDRGLDEATLNAYPKISFSQAKVAHGFNTNKEASSSSSSCSICLGEYKENDVVRVLPHCGHLFHVECVDTWLRLNPTCPICRNSPLLSPMPTPVAQVAPLVWLLLDALY